MSPIFRARLALILALCMPAAALAHSPSGSGGDRPSSSSAASSRESAPTRPPAPPAGGFDLHRDTNPHAPLEPPPASRQPFPTQQRPPVAQRPVSQTQTNPRSNLRTAPYTQRNYGPYTGQFHGQPIQNPQYGGPSWGWNHGVQWYPAQTYWGGGFWGPFAIGALSGALFFGSVIDYQDQEIYPSYQIAEDSPGASVLESYGLQQTPCGPPNLVVIWGPNNSVICAYPNDLVAPGNYGLDPSTLTIVSK